MIAPRDGDNCSVCDGSLDHRLDDPDGGSDRHWVALRCHFQCRSCGHLSPLNGLDVDGSVLCQHCGLDQVFDVDSWQEGIAHAHAVGDLAGPGPEGRFPHPMIAIADANPFRRIGLDRTSAELSQGGMIISGGVTVTRSLQVDASPGRPLCHRCQVVLDSQVDGQQLTTSCPSCHNQAHYELPRRAAGTHEGLLGVLSKDQRGDHLQVVFKQDASGGAILLGCPSCGANLTAAQEGRIVTCQFCQAVVRIPDKLLMRALQRPPVTEIWWLLFEGPSPRRRQLELGVEDDDADDDMRRRPIDKPPQVQGPMVFRLALGVLIPLAFLIVIGLMIFGQQILAALGYRIVF